MADPFYSPFGFAPMPRRLMEPTPQSLPPLIDELMRAGQGIDYGGAPNIGQIAASNPAGFNPPPVPPVPLGGSGVFREEDFSPTARDALMPQTPQEAEALQLQAERFGRGAVVAPFALAGPVGGRVGPQAGRVIAQTLARPGIRTAAAPTTVAGVTVAGGGQAEPPDPLDPDIAKAQTEVERITGRQDELRKTLTDIKAQTDRFNPGRLSKLPAGKARTDEIKEIQTELKRLNLYKGRIDGNWGSGTASAVDDRLAQLRDERQTANAELKDLTGQFTAQDRALKGLQRQQQRNRIEREMPWWDQALRDYGTPIGLIGGGPFGAAGRWGVTRSVNRIRQTQADRANEMISRSYGNVSDRVGGINRFYQEGGGNPPFRLSPTARGGFTETSRGRNAIPQTPATSLYPAGNTYIQPADPVSLAGLTAIGGIGEYRLQHALSDLEAAKIAADANPASTEHQDNLARAEARVNQLRLYARIMQGAPLGYALAGAKLGYRNIRPDVDRAAGEVRRLSQWRRRQ